ncbi:MAG: purine-binding chemotaxis protein CheW [Spirochaetaceae bacterium]|nr:purine-binding chemotaxis protein CheW [Spirochaetaceae bacterium]
MATVTEERDQLDELWADDDEEVGTRKAKYLFFNLGDELYGINIMNVTEIIEMERITEVPDMPDYVKGVINLRGKVIPVMDLRLRFNMPEREYDDRTCIVVTAVDTASLGLIVDTVAEVHALAVADIEETPSFSGSAKDHYVEGIGKVGDRVTVLIDARKVLQGEEMRGIKSQI